MAVQHEGQIIPTQEAPQRPNILRNFTERTTHTPSHHLDSNGPGRRWVDKLAQLDVHVPRDTADGNGAGRVRNAVVPRQPFLPDASIDFAALTPSLTVDSALHRYDNL